MKKRFLSLCKSDFASAVKLLPCVEGMMRRESESFPLPSKRESALVLGVHALHSGHGWKVGLLLWAHLQGE